MLREDVAQALWTDRIRRFELELDGGVTITGGPSSSIINTDYHRNKDKKSAEITHAMYGLTADDIEGLETELDSPDVVINVEIDDKTVEQCEAEIAISPHESELDTPEQMEHCETETREIQSVDILERD